MAALWKSPLGKRSARALMIDSGRSHPVRVITPISLMLPTMTLEADILGLEVSLRQVIISHNLNPRHNLHIRLNIHLQRRHSVVITGCSPAAVQELPVEDHFPRPTKCPNHGLHLLVRLDAGRHHCPCRLRSRGHLLNERHVQPPTVCRVLLLAQVQLIVMDCLRLLRLIYPISPLMTPADK